ncbi:MAG: hypothetical protein RR052_00020 [Oscillospiraceae bacterium]
MDNEIDKNLTEDELLEKERLILAREQEIEQREKEIETVEQEVEKKRLRDGLYSKVKVSTRTMNIFIGVLVVIIVVCLVYGIAMGQR